jgi:mono/diheme cytochrome c family protein
MSVAALTPAVAQEDNFATGDADFGLAAPAPSSAEPVMPEAPSLLPGAIIYLQKCTGCHTLGGGNLSGPDLKPTSVWPRTDLRTAIVRMEKSVGPMDDAEIEALIDLLLSPEAGSQVEAAQQQKVLSQTAKLEPGSAAVGHALFHGRRSFTNGGLSCSACHAAEGRGGNLAADLHTSFARLGELPLMSSMENPGFPLMRAVYTARPITRQEATHVTAYLESVAGAPAPAAEPPLHLAGMGLAAAAFAGIAFAYRNRLRGVRARLVARAEQTERSVGR